MGHKTQWCPKCRTNAYQEDAGFPLDPAIQEPWLQRLGFKEFLESVFPDLESAGYLRYRRCMNCKEVWNSVEMPGELVGKLVVEVSRLKVNCATDALGFARIGKVLDELKAESSRLEERIGELTMESAEGSRMPEEPLISLENLNELLTQLQELLRECR